MVEVCGFGRGWPWIHVGLPVMLYIHVGSVVGCQIDGAVEKEVHFGPDHLSWGSSIMSFFSAINIPPPWAMWSFLIAS